MEDFNGPGGFHYCIIFFYERTKAATAFLFHTASLLRLLTLAAILSSLMIPGNGWFGHYCFVVQLPSSALLKFKNEDVCLWISVLIFTT